MPWASFLLSYSKPVSASKKGLHADLEHAISIYPQFHNEAACVNSEGLRVLIVTETCFAIYFSR